MAYVEDRNAQIEKLQNKKADGEKDLAALEEEGRKAGARPACFADAAAGLERRRA